MVSHAKIIREFCQISNLMSGARTARIGLLVLAIYPNDWNRHLCRGYHIVKVALGGVQQWRVAHLELGFHPQAAPRFARAYFLALQTQSESTRQVLDSRGQDALIYVVNMPS